MSNHQNDACESLLNHFEYHMQGLHQNLLDEAQDLNHQHQKKDQQQSLGPF